LTFCNALPHFGERAFRLGCSSYARINGHEEDLKMANQNQQNDQNRQQSGGDKQNQQNQQNDQNRQQGGGDREKRDERQENQPQR
jgi:hypothetical protein